jgi:hypothetical protein
LRRRIAFRRHDKYTVGAGATLGARPDIAARRNDGKNTRQQRAAYPAPRAAYKAKVCHFWPGHAI